MTMDWFINKRGYLVALGLFSIGPLIALMINISFHGFLDGLNIFDESIGVPLVIVNIVITIIGFVISIYFLFKQEKKSVINEVICLVLCAPIFMLYMIALIFFISNL